MSLFAGWSDNTLGWNITGMPLKKKKKERKKERIQYVRFYAFLKLSEQRKLM